jgi:hypothetical protein
MVRWCEVWCDGAMVQNLDLITLDLITLDLITLDLIGLGEQVSR